MLQGKFRWKAILLLVVCSMVIGAGWFFLHKYQRSTTHGHFLELAKRAEESTPPQYDRAARFLRLYLLVKRDDVDTWIRYGILLDDKLQNTSKLHALNAYKRVLELDKNNKDVQLRAAKIYIDVDLEKAVHLLTTLESGDAVDAEVYLLLGKYNSHRVEKLDEASQQARWNRAQEYFRKAIDRAPKKVEAYARLAQLLRAAQKKPMEAAGVLDELIQVNGTDHQAYLIRSAFRQAGSGGAVNLATTIFGLTYSPSGQGAWSWQSSVIGAKSIHDLEGAGEDLAIARKLAPDKAEVLLASSMQEVLLAREKKHAEHFDAGRNYLKRAGELHKDDVRVLPQLAALEVAADNRLEAIKILEEAQKKATDKKDRVRLLWDLANLLLDEGNLGRAEAMHGEMKKIGKEAYYLQFLQARIAMKKNQWSAAIDLLESARLSVSHGMTLQANPDMALQANLLLGQCFEQVANVEQQLVVYQRALKLDPLNPIARFGVARSLAALDRLDEAVAEMRTLGGADLFYARLLIQKNARLGGRADWNEVRDILKASKAIEATILQAEVAFAEGMFAESQGKMSKGKVDAEETKKLFAKAEAILQKAKEDFPESIEPWIASSALAGRLGNAEAIDNALNILNEAKMKFPERSEWRLAMLRYAPAKKEEALPFLRPLAEKINEVEPSKQVRLHMGLAEAFERAGDVLEAERHWGKAVELERSQLGIHLFAFDFYLRTNNLDGMKKTLETIKEIEGADGPFGHFGSAQYLAYQAGKRTKDSGKGIQALTQEEKDTFAEARELLDKAEKKRSRWSRIPASLAGIAEMEGKTELAIQHMQKAVELGNRQLPLLKALVSNLMAKQRWADADEILRKFQEEDFSSDNYLQMRAAEISLFNKNADQALDLTQKAVAGDSKNFQDYLWKGQMLAALGKKEEAESSLRTAIRLAGDDPGPWVVLVALEARNDDFKKASAIMEEMKTKISPKKLTFALAQCYQIIGQQDEAKKHYLESLVAQPNDLDLLKAVVEFYQNTGNLKDSEDHLRHILALNPNEENLAWANRKLAIALGSKGMDFIEQNLQKNPTSVDDLLVKGLLLAGTPEGRSEAIRILEKVFSIKHPSADQMFILASLYESEKDGWQRKARSYMIDLISTHRDHEKHQVYLAAFVDKLMFHEERGEADIWVARLMESIKKNQADPKRLAVGTSLVTGLVRRYPRLRDSIVAEIKATLESSARKTGENKNMLVLADFLGTSGNVDDTLELCELLFKALPPEQVVAVAVSAVSSNAINNKPGSKEAAAQEVRFKRVEALLKSGRDKQPKSDVFWDMQLAVLKERQADYAEAESLYRGILKRERNNWVAMNNLAFLLGLRGAGKEALELIQTVIAKVGPAAELLDSRAAILCAQRKTTDAEKDIRIALGEARTPYRLFHLAHIHQTAGNTKDAIRDFKDAKELGLKLEMLHPLEVDQYEALLVRYEESLKLR